ncbi:NADH dehydrogenase [Synergistales bacterium]|nr:NADH dehydrogenase [Synergistales bacterium]
MNNLYNETVGFILGRRSVRSFEPRNVEPEKVSILLECGFAAPSAKNLQPCHLIVVDDKELLRKMGNSVEQFRMLTEAPLAIAVAVDVEHYEKVHKITDGTWMEDASAVTENILIAARSLGLEGCWLQVANRPGSEEVALPALNLPSGANILALVVLGYGKEHKSKHKGVDETRLHKNAW